MQDTRTDRELVIRDCGTVGYAQALAMQKDLLKQRQRGLIGNTVLLVEHRPVITLGVRESENKLLVTEKALNEKGIELYKVQRGGGITAHNPGQIVMYPIVDIRSLGLGVSDYIRELESIGIELLAQLGAGACRRKRYPGLWVGEKKIASIGVKIKKWVTFHGIAINICNDLTIFGNIVPCGIEDVEITNVLEITKKKIPLTQVREMLSDICRKHWS